MGKTISFTIPGHPKGQPRARFARMGKFVRTYDTKEAVSRKQEIAAYAMQAGVKPFGGPVMVEIWAEMPRPQRLCRKRDPQGVLPAMCKPDCDNIAKSVCDALIGVAYPDDAAVVDQSVHKFYHKVGGVPSMWVDVTWMDHETERQQMEQR